MGENNLATWQSSELPINNGAEFGSQLAREIRDFVERKLAPLRIAVAQLEGKNARLESEIAAHRSVKYMGVFRDGAEYSEGSLVTLHGSLFHANRTTKMIPGDGSRDWKCQAWPRRQRRSSTMKRDAFNDQNVIARWSSHGLTPKQMAARAEADMDEFMEERIAEFEVDMQDAGADMDELAKMMAQKRIEYAAWKAEKLAYLERWFTHGGETLQ
jgi:hypothetical protein